MKTSGKNYYSRSVLIATGGKSYPQTGSRGGGYAIAESAGHTVTKLEPALIPLVCEEKYCSDMMGLSLKMLIFRFTTAKKIYGDIGEMLFTHFGISGPLVLSASSHIEQITPGRYTVKIDLKPGLTDQKLDLRIQRDFSENINRIFGNSLSKLCLPSLYR